MMFSMGVTQAGGRPDKSWKSWFGHIGGGYSLAQGDFGDHVDDGFYLNAGATYWPEDWVIGIDLDLAYSDYDINRETIDHINDLLELDGQTGSIERGGVDSWQLTTNAQWSPTTGGGVGFYLTGGVGVYRLEGQLKTTGLVFYPPICGGYWWPWCIPGGVGPGTIIAASEATTKFGWNVGAAVTFEIGTGGSQIYIEAKYHTVETTQSASYVPITVGYRW